MKSDFGKRKTKRKKKTRCLCDEHMQQKILVNNISSSSLTDLKKRGGVGEPYLEEEQKMGQESYQLIFSP